MNQHSGAATLPRGFRFSGHDAPKTPEPTTQGEEAQMPQIPSPLRPRLKLKRRVVSQLSAPTQQFLASVAAADVPIPSIEEPEPEPEPTDFEMSGINVLSRLHEDDRDMHLLQPRGRAFSPPKTPAPGFVPSLSPTRYPNWTIDSAISSSVESTPDYESSRPSTSRSTQTSASLFSRISHLSDDDHCDNSEVDAKERYVFSPDDDVESRGQADAKGKLRKAPWTKPMSDHLWSTFVLYLQDPKVTPFRMGKSCIPPHGVMLRVSREAKRSWKGSKALVKTTKPGKGRKSGSSTPTAESSGTYMQWPHTCAATRSHLRELCKLKAAYGVKHHLLSRSPTPFTQSAARHWNRRSTPGRTPSGFTQDMSMSLVLSTSDAMQPQGPLAQLTKSAPEPAPVPAPEPAERIPFPAFAGPAVTTFEGEPSFAERQRLGSPFGARSYGPSSSGSLAAALSGSPMPRRLTHTVGPRRLQSPVRLSRTSTQKRRHTQSSDPRKRPSIDSSLWIDPSTRSSGSAVTMEAARSADFSSTSTNRFDEFFIPRIPAEPALSTSSSMPNVGGQLEAPALLPPPPRLGSPFSATNSSFSFPNRLHRSQHGASVDLGMLGRPFATFQQPTESNAPRTSLAGRLAYIDQRLKELHRRRRSESPL